jgi:predicted O-methyltransferase YrrM
VSRTANALRYPRRYADAARIMRDARAVAGEATFEEAYAFAREVGITQQEDEIRWLFDIVRAERPRYVLEIGLDEGGTLFLWTRTAAFDAQLVSVDTRPAGPLRMRAPFPLARRAFAHGRQRVDLVMAADSHDQETLARVEKLFAGKRIDFLFIDGDHSREGVWQDFSAYSPLVRPGGLVAFHDVSQTPGPSTEGVAAFWREFTAEHETDERVAGLEPGLGIGIYRVPTG